MISPSLCAICGLRADSRAPTLRTWRRLLLGLLGGVSPAALMQFLGGRRGAGQGAAPPLPPCGRGAARCGYRTTIPARKKLEISAGRGLCVGANTCARAVGAEVRPARLSQRGIGRSEIRFAVAAAAAALSVVIGGAPAPAQGLDGSTVQSASYFNVSFPPLLPRQQNAQSLPAIFSTIRGRVAQPIPRCRSFR
jgi:hypothetical protein